MAGIPFDSCTGRAISVRDHLPVGGAAPIAIADPHGWISAGLAFAALGGRGPRIVISARLDDMIRYNLIKNGMACVCLAEISVSELQDAVESDPGILLTVDFARRDVRARSLVARFDIGGGDEVARGLLIAQRLLCSSGLAGDDRVRLQHRLVAIGDAVKVPGADAARCAWRLDRLLADIAQAEDQGRPAGASSTPWCR